MNTGGYYHSLPGDPLRTFIDTAAEVQRAMGFENEKDHPEVAPSQFEINYGYGEVVAAADQIQLYKLICRQVATKMGMTASFLPKPVVGVNGSGMHTNVSISKGRQEYLLGSEGRGEAQQVRLGVCRPHSDARQRYLPAAECERECVSPAGSALRSAEPDQGFGGGSRLDGAHSDRQREEHARGSALGGPDANPYLVLYSIFKTGIEGDDGEDREPAPGGALSAGQHLHGDGQTSARRSGRRSCWART